MSTKPLSWWENIAFWLGAPRRAPADAQCFKCKSKLYVIDLGDGDFICQSCWDNWIPSYDE